MTCLLFWDKNETIIITFIVCVYCYHSSCLQFLQCGGGMFLKHLVYTVLVWPIRFRHLYNMIFACLVFNVKFVHMRKSDELCAGYTGILHFMNHFQMYTNSGRLTWEKSIKFQRDKLTLLQKFLLQAIFRTITKCIKL